MLRTEPRKMRYTPCSGVPSITYVQPANTMTSTATIYRHASALAIICAALASFAPAACSNNFDDTLAPHRSLIAKSTPPGKATTANNEPIHIGYVVPLSGAAAG